MSLESFTIILEQLGYNLLLFTYVAAILLTQNLL